MASYIVLFTRNPPTWCTHYEFWLVYTVFATPEIVFPSREKISHWVITSRAEGTNYLMVITYDHKCCLANLWYWRHRAWLIARSRGSSWSIRISAYWTLHTKPLSSSIWLCCHCIHGGGGGRNPCCLSIHTVKAVQEICVCKSCLEHSIRRLCCSTLKAP